MCFVNISGVSAIIITGIDVRANGKVGVVHNMVISRTLCT